MANLNIPVGALLGQADPETHELPHVMVKLPSGQWVEYMRLPSGEIGRRAVERSFDSKGLHRWPRFDLSGIKPGQAFPWKVPWTNHGFYGALSGGGGTATIHEDGRIEIETDWIS